MERQKKLVLVPKESRGSALNDVGSLGTMVTAAGAHETELICNALEAQVR